MEPRVRPDKWGLWELPRSICIKVVRSRLTISLNHLPCPHWPPGRTQNTERHSGKINYEAVVWASVGDLDLLCTEDLWLENDSWPKIQTKEYTFCARLLCVYLFIAPQSEVNGQLKVYRAQSWRDGSLGEMACWVSARTRVWSPAPM